MTELSNKTPEEINSYLKKYASILESIKDKAQISAIAIVLEVCVNYLNTKYAGFNSVIKAWAVFVIRKLYKNKLVITKYDIKTDEDIYKTIDEFIDYYVQGHQEAIKDIELFASEFDRDYNFVHEFINKAVI